MQPLKIVSVCTSGLGRKDDLRNVSIPSRTSSSRFKKHNNPKSYFRSKSTDFLSEFRPVQYIEMQERPIKLIKVKRTSQKNKNSYISTISKEMKSICVTENYNNSSNLVSNDQEESHTQDIEDQCIYKVHNYNNLSKTDKRIIANRVHRNNLRWTNVSNQMKIDNKSCSFQNNKIDKRPKITELEKYDPTEKPLQTANREKQSSIDDNLNHEEKFVVTSISNSLTNFVTMDDICGIRNEWTKQNIDRNLPIREAGAPPTSSVENNKEIKGVTNRSKRELVLRDYMNVYLNWRVTTSIQEHHDFLFGRPQCSRIRTALPKIRLQTFQKILNNKQATLSKTINLEDNNDNQSNPEVVYDNGES